VASALAPTPLENDVDASVDSIVQVEARDRTVEPRANVPFHREAPDDTSRDAREIEVEEVEMSLDRRIQQVQLLAEPFTDDGVRPDSYQS
jgi:hypothetical protein